MMHSFFKGALVKPISKPSTSNEKKSSAPTPWVEKYRPKTVDEIAYQEQVVAVLKKFLSNGGADMPNILFYGPPGTGKTSTILAASRELFGDMYRSRILELNASDERGIQVIREKVKNFAQQTASAVRPDGKPCPPFKIVILDEADSMTSAAQAALRRLMEKESKTTRFCLLCNYVSRIIEPITSRCAKFRFKPLSIEAAKKKLIEICTKENVNCPEDALLALIKVSDGDLRKAVTTLQSAHYLKSGDDGNSECLTVLEVNEMSGVIPEKLMVDFVMTCKSTSHPKIHQFVNERLIMEGYAASQFFSQIHEFVVGSSEFGEVHKAKIADKLAVCDFRLLDGADEYMQVMDLAAVVSKNINI